ncbi:hypothetical protein B0T16DRAFT_418782 [Cercophora newfieldiana]|uniref:Uncharacterized protein n=1 Tax=Cercophora newfieldiana TaxID=92897 RepID=A0AA40CJA2_9PEZI|nr:hypothetical protein B0T16DRAFT_418782 [Cercophora newfieldiana]
MSPRPVHQPAPRRRPAPGTNGYRVTADIAEWTEHCRHCLEEAVAFDRNMPLVQFHTTASPRWKAYSTIGKNGLPRHHGGTWTVVRSGPHSFENTAGDGIGDVTGIIRRLDYFVGLVCRRADVRRE